jgi:predicted transport protein
MEEVPKKLYVAYRTSQNVVCMEVKTQKVVLYLKLNPKEILNPPNIVRDVTNIGHFGTGNLEVTVKGINSLEIAKRFIALAYQKVGG